MNRLLLDVIEIDLEDLTVYVDVYDSSLSRKWLASLNNLIVNNYHLEKNYCFFGFTDGPRNGAYICKQINESIAAINAANIGYTITDHFAMENCIVLGSAGDNLGAGGSINHAHLNELHRYFEDLQGVSGRMSPFYTQADDITRWHIRQLNGLCHEFESWALSYRKKHTAPEWMRPSQLMCWLNSPRFILDDEDYELFGIESINRPTGGVFVGVNKAVGKHHWEVFVDEAQFDPEHRTDLLTTTTLKPQTEAAGDFDIEWARNPAGAPWQTRNLNNFRSWLTNNGFDPEDKSLTIGHPQVGQVNLIKTFGTEDYASIWAQLNTRLNVTAIRTSDASVEYPYNWSDSDYMRQQIKSLQGR
jgi:hypothetical protein